MIPGANPLASYTTRKAEIDAAIAEVLASGRYILGHQVADFENEFASYVGVRHAIGVGSGTEALHIALRACGVGHGDEVITVSHTAVATVAAIELAGARPILVDIEPNHYTLDPECLDEAITERTRAIVPVHLYGHPADMAPILRIGQRHGLRVIEDCAQALGARYADRVVGSLGDIAAFSFYPTKNLGAFGDGGMVATDDDELAERVRLLREYGWRERYVSHISGWNTRLDELQAAILRVKLRHLDEDNASRRRIALGYGAHLSGAVVLPAVRSGSEHAYHLFVIRATHRDELLAHVKSLGIGVLIHYPSPVHRQPAYRDRLEFRKLTVTEEVVPEILSLPMFPQLSDEDVRTVSEAVLSRRLDGRLIGHRA